MRDKKRNFKILVAEDSETMREGIESSLKREGYTVETVEDGIKAASRIEKNRYDLLISDIRMPGMDGIRLLEKTMASSPGTTVILITAYATVETAVEALKKGAADFITKPFSLAELRSKTEGVFRRKISEIEIYAERKEKEIIGSSEAIKKIIAIIAKVAETDSPVLITGESGTGKELVANAIHRKSFRKEGEFVAINCAALNENLLESELFGHEKGAFTGAYRTHRGMLERAHKGTLFLDEIGEMPLSLQVKLLRVLQTRQFTRVGGEKQYFSDFRLICATNRDLEASIKEGNFREDLYYRLNVIPIYIPPLRQRREDIPVLLQHIIARKCHELQREKPVISESFFRKATQYDWPGNVREMENFVERTLVFSTENTFNGQAFQFDIGDSGSETENTNLETVVDRMERKMIVDALRKCKGVKKHAADQLNLKLSTLYYKMEKHGITEDEYK